LQGRLLRRYDGWGGLIRVEQTSGGRGTGRYGTEVPEQEGGLVLGTVRGGGREWGVAYHALARPVFFEKVFSISKGGEEE
jgi:hypothetical protein